MIFFGDLTINLRFRRGSTTWSPRVQLINCLRPVAHFEDTYLFCVFRVKSNFELVWEWIYFDLSFASFVFKFNLLDDIIAIENKGVRVLVEPWVESYVKDLFLLQMSQVYRSDLACSNIQGSKWFLWVFVEQKCVIWDFLEYASLNWVRFLRRLLVKCHRRYIFKLVELRYFEIF